jgi:hypothetical protein
MMAALSGSEPTKGSLISHLLGGSILSAALRNLSFKTGDSI